MDSICDIVRKAEDDYIKGNTVISEHVTFSLKDNVDRIEAYKNSKHISGDTDSLGREKPFFNIGTAASNVWYRATDLDRKNIKVRATKKSNYVASLLASIKLQDSMRRNNFGIWLNNWGRTLADYGSAVSKHVEKDGQLISTVVPWNRLIVDAVSFDGSVKIEKLYLTPAQLRENPAYDKKVVKTLIDSKVSRTTLGKEKKDTKSDYIELYEVHGLMDDNLLKDEKEEEASDQFSQQVHVVSFIQKDDGEYDDYTLYKGKEEKDPYFITHLIEEDGRVMAIGAYERLFEAQWMKNHSVKSIKDYLDVASKVFMQTSDGNFVGTNVLSNLENGDFFIHGINQPITAVNNNNAAGFQAMQAYGQEWEGLGNKTAGISEAMLGEQKSGTAWRQTEALLQESHSLFELMTENKALALEEIIKIYFIPFIKKQLNTKAEVTATLKDYGVKEIEQMYLKNESIRQSNQKNIEAVLNDGEFTTPEDEMATLQDGLNQTGTQRFLAVDEIGEMTWADLLEDLEWEIEIDITGEQRDIQSAMTTLNTLYANLAQDPTEVEAKKLVRDKILEITGVVSPLELQSLQTTQQIAPTGGGAVQPVGL